MGTYFRQLNQQLRWVVHSRFPWFPSKRNRGEGVGDMKNTLNRLVHCKNLFMHAATVPCGSFLALCRAGNPNRVFGPLREARKGVK